MPAGWVTRGTENLRLAIEEALRETYDPEGLSVCTLRAMMGAGSGVFSPRLVHQSSPESLCHACSSRKAGEMHMLTMVLPETNP